MGICMQAAGEIGLWVLLIQAKGSFFVFTIWRYEIMFATVVCSMQMTSNMVDMASHKQRAHFNLQRRFAEWRCIFQLGVSWVDTGSNTCFGNALCVSQPTTARRLTANESKTSKTLSENPVG